MRAEHDQTSQRLRLRSFCKLRSSNQQLNEAPVTHPEFPGSTRCGTCPQLRCVSNYVVSLTRRTQPPSPRQIQPCGNCITRPANRCSLWVEQSFSVPRWLTSFTHFPTPDIALPGALVSGVRRLIRDGWGLLDSFALGEIVGHPRRGKRRPGGVNGCRRKTRWLGR